MVPSLEFPSNSGSFEVGVTGNLTLAIREGLQTNRELSSDRSNRNAGYRNVKELPFQSTAAGWLGLSVSDSPYRKQR